MAYIKIDSSSVGTYAISGAIINSDVAENSGIGIMKSWTGNSIWCPYECIIGDIDGNGHYGIIFLDSDNKKAAAGVVTSSLYSYMNSSDTALYLYCIEFDIRVIPDDVKHTSQSGNVFVVGGSDAYNGFNVYWSTTDSVRTFTFHQIFSLERNTWHHVRLQAVSCSYSSTVWDLYCDGVLKGQTTQGFSTGVPSFRSCSLSSLNSGTYGDGGTKIDVANFEMSLTPNAVEQRPLISASGEYSDDVLSAVANIDKDSRTQSVTTVWRDETEQISDNANASIDETGIYYIIATDSNGYTNVKEVHVNWGFVHFIPFPCLPLQMSYSVSSEPNVIRTAMYDGRSRQRIMTGGKKYKTLKCQFIMTEQQLSQWKEKWKTELHEGADWFYLQVLGDSDFIKNKTVRLNKGEWSAKLKYRNEIETVYDVTMNFEVR